MRIIAATFLLISGCTLVSGQQIAFTSRAHIQCPLIVTSTQESKTYGFESIVLQNDEAMPVRAIRLKVTLKTGAGEEITDDRRVTVDMDAHDHKRVVVDLGHIEGLRQKTKSRQQESALAILTITSVEFQDGTLWDEPDPVAGTPIDTPILPKK